MRKWATDLTDSTELHGLLLESIRANPSNPFDPWSIPQWLLDYALGSRARQHSGKRGLVAKVTWFQHNRMRSSSAIYSQCQWNARQQLALNRQMRHAHA